MSIKKTDFPRDVPKPPLPICDWVYFATPSQETWSATRGLITECRMIIRSAYNSVGIAIANTRQLREADTILVVFGGGDSGKPYRPMFSCRVVPPPIPVPGFEGVTYADAMQHDRLLNSGYTADPHLHRFTGISIEVMENLERVSRDIPRPAGNNTIRRWNEVFRDNRR
jgi:hypothetical protein